MIATLAARRGMVTAPHHLAASAGLRVLRAGGNAVEAAIAALATASVVYPHMTGIGGDGFWLIAEPGQAPIAIDASGPAGSGATRARYRDKGLAHIPTRGPDAANTVAGTIGGWRLALDHAARWGRPLPLSEILGEAAHHARAGIVVTAGQAHDTARKLPELGHQPGFAECYLVDGAAPAAGSILANPAIAATLDRLSTAGLDDFYRGDLARAVAGDLAEAGCPVSLADFERFRARLVEPLKLSLPGGVVYNVPPSSQGLAALMILGIYHRLDVAMPDGFAHIHGLVEATKLAFSLRDEAVGDPGAMSIDPNDFLRPAALAEYAATIDPARAWREGAKAPDAGDTVWLGVIDGEGRAVSVIQSIFWEFGSGVVSPRTGIVWQNRGSSFTLNEGHPRTLAPGRHPFHTLNPAMARLKDGRTLSYGTMGGDGQPQTQAAVFTRAVTYGQPLQQAVTAPRWLLGRTWGEESATLKIEERIPEALADALAAAGHAVEIVAPFSSLMGHAGALSRRPDGVIEGAADPRSDGVIAAF